MKKNPRHNGTTRGFSRVSALSQGRIRSASESRGFAQSRLLTQWDAVVGPEIAAIARPVEVSHKRGSMGATLTLLTTGAQAPVLEMQKDTIRDRVNACYGYNAIARIRVTQTAPTGFSDGAVRFDLHSKPKTAKAHSEETREKAANIADGVASEDLRLALERLAANVLTKGQPK